MSNPILIYVVLLVTITYIALRWHHHRKLNARANMKKAFSTFDAQHGDIILIPPTTYIPPHTTNRTRVGIVLLSKDPIDFGTWLNYHRSIGVERVYLRVEDTPNLVEYITQEHADFVHMTATSGETSYFSLMDRQTEHMNHAIQLARAHGLTHLLHIDDDELLYLPMGRRVFDAELLNSTGSSIHLQNIEAVYDASNCSNPFHTTTHFCVRPSKFTAYVNGKSFGVLADETLRHYGPHNFTGTIVELPPHVAVIIHYESSCFKRWSQKFTGYASTSPDACKDGKIPFKFYCDSLEAFLKPSSSPQLVWDRWKLRRHRSNDGIVQFKVI